MKNTTRRYHSLSKVGRFVPQVTTPVFKKQGFAQAAIVADWEHIVGPLLADVSQPDGLNFRMGEKTGGVLVISAPGPIALELQYQSLLIIERVNSYFGYKAVDRLKIDQKPFPIKRAVKPKIYKSLDDAELGTISALSEDIDDPVLKETLENLGRAIYQKN